MCRLGDRYSNATIRYFKDSENKLDINKPWVDTIYNNAMADNKDWVQYDGTIGLACSDSKRSRQLDYTEATTQLRKKSPSL